MKNTVQGKQTPKVPMATEEPMHKHWVQGERHYQGNRKPQGGGGFLHRRGKPWGGKDSGETPMGKSPDTTKGENGDKSLRKKT